MVDGKKKRSKLGKMARNKGKVGEREIAKIMQARGFEARRGIQFQGSPDSPDVISDLTFLHIEVKRVEKLNIDMAFQQAMNDAGMEKVPVVFHRKNQKKWLVTLSLFDFLSLIQCVLGMRKDPTNTIRRFIREFKDAKKGRRRRTSTSTESIGETENSSDSEFL